MDYLYLNDIKTLLQSKNLLVRVYARISIYFYKSCMFFKNCADKKALGINSSNFREKSEKILNVSKTPVVTGFSPARFPGAKEHKMMEGKNYREAKHTGNLVPAKPDFFQMTDDVPHEKKVELLKELQPEQVRPTTQSEQTKKFNEKKQFKKNKKRFYYKHKNFQHKKKFDNNNK